MWWHTDRNQISSFGETDESNKSAGASVQSTAVSRGVRISGSNAGYTMLRGSVKGTGYPLHSPVSPSLPLPCVTVCHHISTGLYFVSIIAKAERRLVWSYEWRSRQWDVRKDCCRFRGAGQSPLTAVQCLPTHQTSLRQLSARWKHHFLLMVTKLVWS